MIIDEEQRFGVEHKDALKKLKTNVDILAMSATPIPRTLEMAVTGIREMSTLATPPEDRHPILTFVGPYNDKQVGAAIRRELLREGQVFFVHNRVSSDQPGRHAARRLVPEARIAVAHGQAARERARAGDRRLLGTQFDVLVSTTIIETGLDITNANTLIIDRADKYGLAQLHQLRGRVGRGRERAYAYFLYDDDKPLGEVAHDRLATIAANNELGAGMQVALKDLEIRGAGNLLGGEQSGHIAGVGFDLYLRMIGEAVSTFRGEVAEGQTELRLELPVDARIPEEYVDSERLRLEAYQKLSTASSPAAAADSLDRVLEELTDRYGEPPVQVLNLLAVSRLRLLAQQFGLSEVVAVGPNLRVVGADLADSRQVRLKRMFAGARYLAQTSSVLVPLPTPERGTGRRHGAHRLDPGAVDGGVRADARPGGRCRRVAERYRGRRRVGAVRSAGDAVHAVDDDGNQHQRSQVDERVERDGDQDAPRRQEDRHQQRSDEEGPGHAPDALVEVQQPEQRDTPGHRDGGISRRREDQHGQRQPEQQFLDDAGVHREQPAVPKFRPVSRQQGRNVTDRRHLVGVAGKVDADNAADEESDPGPDCEPRDEAPGIRHQVVELHDSRQGVELVEEQGDVLPPDHGDDQRAPAEDQERLDHPLAVQLLPLRRRAVPLEPAVLALVLAQGTDYQPHQQHHEDRGGDRGGGRKRGGEHAPFFQPPLAVRTGIELKQIGGLGAGGDNLAQFDAARGASPEWNDGCHD